MWDRRVFLQAGVTAATSAALAASSFNAMNGLVSRPGKIGAVLFDPRYRDSRAFAQAFTTLGATSLSTAEDIGRLWMGSLGKLFVSQSGALAGMTTHSDMLISQIFAREIARGRLVFEAMHDSRAAGPPVHSLHIGRSEMGVGDEIVSSGTVWPGVLAARLAQQHSDTAPHIREIVTGGQLSDDHPGTLFSWVIT